LSKKPLRPTSHLRSDPSFKELQAFWYAKLKEEGFNDAEDFNLTDRPLKKWSGFSSLRLESVKTWGDHFFSSFPEGRFRKEEEFTYHPEFNEICGLICKHGRMRFTAEVLKKMWIDHCDGATIRQSEKKYGVSDNRILAALRKIKEWMSLMDLNTPEEPIDKATIVLRDFDPSVDSPIIYATWRNAIWYDSEDRDERLASEFYSKITQEIKTLLKYKDIKVKIACAKDDPDFIAGYSVMRGEHLEFVYVKLNYRKTGIAYLLTRGFKTIAEPKTKIGKAIAYEHELIVGDK
jgi:hypothetical protein